MVTTHSWKKPSGPVYLSQQQWCSRDHKFQDRDSIKKIQDEDIVFLDRRKHLKICRLATESQLHIQRQSNTHYFAMMFLEFITDLHEWLETFHRHLLPFGFINFIHFCQIFKIVLSQRWDYRRLKCWSFTKSLLPSRDDRPFQVLETDTVTFMAKNHKQGVENQDTPKT